MIFIKFIKMIKIIGKIYGEKYFQREIFMNLSSFRINRVYELRSTS